MSKVVADNKLFSLSEWYQKIDHQQTDELRKEDNDKRERLEVLFNEIGLKFDRPDKFPAKVVAERQPEFLEYLEDNRNRLCAFRLVPNDSSLPKLRMRGKSVNDALEWFDKQKIDYEKYRLDIVPHTDKTVWSSIFMVKPDGIIGEIIRGGHSLLTMGNADEVPLFFKYNYQDWNFSKDDKEAQSEIKKAVSQLLVEDKKIQEHLKDKLQSKFINNYLAGYFEFTTWPDENIYFIDYNRLLDDLIEISEFVAVKSSDFNLNGVCGYQGQAEGKVVLVTPEEISTKDFPHGSILVCEMTTPDYLPLMKKASAIITDKGGILSHAAIVARELNIPCIIGTGQATKILKDGNIIKIDAGEGKFEIVNN